VHELIQQATQDIERQQFNTVVSAGMKLLNVLTGSADHSEYLVHEGIQVLCRILWPIIPHVTEAIWRDCGFKGLLADSLWPRADQDALKRDTIKIAVQINGKVRAELEVPTEATQADLEALAHQSEKLQPYLSGKIIRKCVYVRGRLLNFVVGDA
jgi:leucyl-tRNA synthetase